MGFSINTNIASLQAQNYLRINSNFQDQTISEVTSGYRIVQSGDDAAGLAIANGYRAEETVLTQGIQNANDGLNQLQIIDGGMSNISQLLDRASTLATQSASGTFTGDRSVLNSEFQSVIGEINRQSQAIGMNTNGTFAKSLSVFIGGGQGPNGAAAIQNGSIDLDLSHSTVDAKSLGLMGVQASGVSGSDIGPGSATTSVADILNPSSGNQQATPGYTDFYVNGPGFSGPNAIQLHVNLSGVTDSGTLVDAINTAIQNAGNGVSQAATAFMNANVTASINTDGNGHQQLTFNSSNTSFQVSAGDQMANALLGNLGARAVMTGANSPATIDTSAAGANVLTLSFNGGPAMNFDVTAGAAVPMGVTGDTTPGTIVGDLNSNGAFSANAVASVNTSGDLVITSLDDNAGSTITVGDTTLATALGLSGTARVNPATGKALTETATATLGATGTTPLTAVVRFQGGGLASPVDITLGTSAVPDANQTAAVSDLLTQVNANSTLKSAGITASSSNGQLVFTSDRGQSFSVSSVGDTTNELGLGSYASSGTGFDYDTITGATVAPDPGNTEYLDFSVAGSPTQEIMITSAGGDTGASYAAQINAAITSNATLAAAGLHATGTATNITLASQNGTLFRVAERQGTSATPTDILGFGTPTTNAVTSSTNSAGQIASQSSSTTDDSYFNAGGSSSTAIFPFNPILNGQDQQTISISANDSTGNPHSTSIVLSDSAASGSGASLDAAINAINDQLQQSEDPTLQSIVAVKDQMMNSDGAAAGEGIRFISTLSQFSVSLGAAGTGTPVGIGATNGSSSAPDQGTVQVSTNLAGGGAADVSNQSSAEAAVTALATAVTILGNAQASVGKGENQFTYAVNLAQSQVTNLAAAESSIRDADLAAESANLTKAQILIQAGVAALAQANSAPQQVLALLKQ